MSWDAPLRLCQCKCKRFLGRGGSESERALLGSGEEGKVGGTEWLLGSAPCSCVMRLDGRTSERAGAAR